MSKITINAWAINESRSLMEASCSRLCDTAARYGASIELLGIGEKFVEHKQRLRVLKADLEKRDPGDVVVYMDGFDTLVNDTEQAMHDKLLAMDTRILISAEKRYTHQYPGFRTKFDRIQSEYRYINAGTFMGYAGDLLTMCEGMMHIDTQVAANDQGLMGIWVSLLLEHGEWVKVDSNCEIFWVTTDDWQRLESIALAGGVLVNPTTGARPAVIHCVATGAPQSKSCFDAVYRNIMEGRDGR